MKKLNKNQWIAVASSIGLLAFMFYGSNLMAIFNMGGNMQEEGDERVGALESGVQTRDIVVGSGETARAGDTLTVHYVGRLTDGKVFDSSRDRGTPFTFTLGVGQVIRGWDEGMAGMRVGGRRRLTIAPDYGYGSNAVGSIPPGSTLVFEVELLEIDRAE